MTDLENLMIRANREFVRTQLHWSLQPGAGQAAGFAADIDRTVDSVEQKMTNLAAGSGIDIAAAKADLESLAARVKAAPIEVPAAA